MAKNSGYHPNNIIFKILLWAVFLTLLVPLLFTENLLYPFIATKALFFRSVIILALPFYVYLLIKYKECRPNFKNYLTWAVVVFFLLSLISTIFGADFQRSFWGNYERMGGVFDMFHLCLLYAYLLLIFQTQAERGRKFLLGVCAISFLTSLYAVFESWGLRLFTDASAPDRYSSTFGNPIFFASFLIIPIFVTGFFALSEEIKWKRNFYWFAVLIQFVGVFLSQTRGAVVGLMAGACLFGLSFLFNSGKKSFRYLAGALLVIAILGGGLLFAFRGSLPQSSLFGRVFNFNDSNSKARIIQWESGIKGFKDHPILGVGPENYYVIANKYFNPEIYKYDSSWFDKPHNFWLEILLTGGILGFVSYLSIILISMWAFWKAYKANLISFSQAFLIFSGMLAYQIQNLFAFDTTSASWIFFVFLAFAGYLWQESVTDSKAVQIHKKSSYAGLASAAAIIIGIIAVYVWYVADWTTAKVLHNLNYAYSIGVKQPTTADKYFQLAASQPFIYDPGDLGIKYSEFAISIGQDEADILNHNFINQALDNSAAVLEKETAKVNNNPIYWFHLANDYDTKSILNKTPVDPRSITAVNNAIALAPNRVEPKFFLVQIYGLQNDIPKVVSESEEIAREVPFFPDVQWRLALAYKDAGRLDDAVRVGEQAISEGYQFKLVQEFKWLINYYADQQNYQRVADLYEQAVKLSPEDYQLYASLATVYAKLGEKDKAIQTAQKVVQLNPASQPSVDAFIKSLQ